MSAKWRLTVHPILGYQGEKGVGPPIVFLEGANIHHYAFVDGAIILPCQLHVGQMSTHAIFHRGADVRGGGGGEMFCSRNNSFRYGYTRSACSNSAQDFSVPPTFIRL